jgi:hypothetical protein
MELSIDSLLSLRCNFAREVIIQSLILKRRLQASIKNTILIAVSGENRLRKELSGDFSVDQV